MAVAVFNTNTVVGEAVVETLDRDVRIRAHFSVLPAGKHGFHIHRAGDLRGEGCAGACDHWHIGRTGVRHGSAPDPTSGSDRSERHTGDLGNVVAGQTYTYILKGVRVADLWGRTLIVHADEDDLGLGSHADSGTTGHSGARIGCAVFGRTADCPQKQLKGTRYAYRHTRKRRHS
jgi:Cu-Zn family superoxide dismutase